MPEISRFYGIIISMFYNDHNPPHFHAKYGEFRADICIKNFAVISGSLPPKAFALVVEWAAQHKEELMNDWEAARQEIPLSPINPLE